MSTRAAARKAQLDHLLDMILEAQGNNDHVVHLITNAQGATTAADVANISEANLQKMTLKDSNGTDVHIPGAIMNKILNLSDFFIHYVDRQTHDWTPHNEFDLETFMLTGTGPLTPTTALSNPLSPVQLFHILLWGNVGMLSPTTIAAKLSPQGLSASITSLETKNPVTY